MSHQNSSLLRSLRAAPLVVLLAAGGIGLSAHAQGGASGSTNAGVGVKVQPGGDTSSVDANARAVTKSTSGMTNATGAYVPPSTQAKSGVQDGASTQNNASSSGAHAADTTASSTPKMTKAQRKATRDSVGLNNTTKGVGGEGSGGRGGEGSATDRVNARTN